MIAYMIRHPLQFSTKYITLYNGNSLRKHGFAVNEFCCLHQVYTFPEFPTD